MNERQYKQILENHRRRGPRALFQSGPEQAILRAAARSVRRQQAAQEAWERIAAPGWLGQAQVGGVQDGVLEIDVNDEVLCRRLRQQAQRLRRALAPFVPGLLEVRIRARHDAADFPEDNRIS